MQDLNNLRIAVLIDADNIPRDALKPAIEEIAIYGTPTIKRIYGDWTSPNIAGWKQSLLENAVTPVQQYGYTTGKNSTDSAMIIDAMDILYTGSCDGFVLMSSDSDFTRLAIRLREAGKYVIGMGEKKTPNPFIVACDKFIYIEVIRAKYKNQASSTATKKKADTKKKTDNVKTTDKNSKPADRQLPDRFVPDDVEQFIAETISDIADDDGYADLSDLGNLLIKKQPDFDPRSFGFGKLSNMLRSLPRFDVVVRPTADPNVMPIYIKDTEA
ncbi:MAG: NYN domain-containing protein [Oscillospiraceae bacterium]|nr:NYN domain-containing protein [Oscillospiraceae bacterium]